MISHSVSVPAFSSAVPVSSRHGLAPRPRNITPRRKCTCAPVPLGQAPRRAILRAEAGTASPGDKNDGGEDAAPSPVDWDSDWSTFKATGMRTDAGPGRAPPTAQEKAVKKVAAQVQSVTNNLPTRQKLFADWRFWVAILVSLSLFTALVGGSQSQQPVMTGSM